jgi:predicted DCC family thiol-disulfide oxidoreductase YuxK
MRPVILFDGVCHLCNGFVQFILRRDPAGRFDFAPLQSDFAQQQLGTIHLDNIVLLEGTQVYHAEAAALRILSQLRQPWPTIARLAAILPRALQAWAYRWIARNRYKIWGKEEICMLPEPQWKGRFLG